MKNGRPFDGGVLIQWGAMRFRHLKGGKNGDRATAHAAVEAVKSAQENRKRAAALTEQMRREGKIP